MRLASVGPCVGLQSRCRLLAGPSGRNTHALPQWPSLVWVEASGAYRPLCACASLLFPLSSSFDYRGVPARHFSAPACCDPAQPGRRVLAPGLYGRRVHANSVCEVRGNESRPGGGESDVKARKQAALPCPSPSVVSAGPRGRQDSGSGSVGWGLSWPGAERPLLGTVLWPQSVVGCLEIS